MSVEIIDLSSCSNSADTLDKHTENVQNFALENLKKFDINLGKNVEVQFLKFDVSKYCNENYKSCLFGEKLSLLYSMHFVTYNVEFLVKMLSFQYENKMEVLKLDIDMRTPRLNREMDYCCNYLKRRRNLNLMFTLLISFSRFVESRRLVCDLILRKQPNVKIEENPDNGIIVTYSDTDPKIEIGIFWKISFSSEHEICDVVEVFYNNFDFPNKKDIRDKLKQLTHPNLSFIQKYNLWKSLINDIPKSSKTLQSTKTRSSKRHQKSPENLSSSVPIEINDTSEADAVIILSEPDDSSSCSLQSVVPTSSQRVDDGDDLSRNQSGVAKKQKTDSSGNDLQITSVVYVVPD